MKIPNGVLERAMRGNQRRQAMVEIQIFSGQKGRKITIEFGGVHRGIWK